MPAEGVRSRIHGEFRKIDLRYKAIKTELGEDLILNGENLFHFIFPVRLYKSDSLIFRFLDVFGMIMTSMATAACTAGCCKLEPMDSYKTTDRISWVAVRFYSLELLKLGSATNHGGFGEDREAGFWRTVMQITWDSALPSSPPAAGII